MSQISPAISTKGPMKDKFAMMSENGERRISDDG
jgi:hypothetical protein